MRSDQFRLPRWSHFAIAFITSVMFVGLRYAMIPILDGRGPYFLASLAVLITAFIGGLWPGLLATALVTGGDMALYAFVTSPDQIDDNYFRLLTGAQITVCVCISLICGSLRASEQEAERNAALESDARSRLNAVFDSVTDKLLIISREFEILGFNVAAADRWELRNSDIGLRLEERLPASLVAQLMDPMRQVLADNRKVDLEATDAVSGRSYEVRLFPSPQGILAYFDNVTARKQAEDRLRKSEQRFRNLADNSSMMVWTCDESGGATWFNKPWLDFRGLHLEEALAEGCLSKIHPEDEPWVKERYDQAVKAQTPFTLEYRTLSREGQYRWIHVRGNPVLEADGKLAEYMVSTIDVTDRMAIEENLRRILASEQSARSEAESAMRSRDEFLASLSHELRTPLTTILGWTEILTRTRYSERDLADGLKAIDKGSRLQLQLINDLLDMSRISNGKLSLELELADLLEIAHSVVDVMLPNAAEKKIELSLVEPDAPVFVRVDVSRFTQVLWNLVSNAIKFTPKGGKVTMEVGLRDGEAFVSITDTGVGIAADFLPFVFDRFRQADPSRTRRHGGLGLGLAIAKTLVELHRGTISVTSNGPGTGASFTVALPLAETLPITSKPRPRTDAQPVHEPDDRLKDLCILLVEDDAATRDLLKKVLEFEGALVIPAETASLARKLLSETRPDVIVSDIGLPQEDGFQLIRSVRSGMGDGQAGVPALALSAFAGSVDRVKAFEAGFDDFLPKPVESEALVNAVLQVRAKAR
jgi:PAS domain S-box-containing protein